MAGDGFFSDTKLLVHFNQGNGATTFPDIKGHTLTGYNSIAQSTTQSRYGGCSLSLNGSSHYLTTPASGDFNFGTGDFTIEFSIRANAGVGSYFGCVIDYSNATGNKGWIINGNSGGVLSFALNGSPINVSSMNVTDAWHDVAITRKAGTIYIYVDGIYRTSTVNTGSGTSDAANMTIGRYHAGGAEYSGYIDEIRITKGIARYFGTSFSYTPASFPDFPADKYAKKPARLPRGLAATQGLNIIQSRGL